MKRFFILALALVVSASFLTVDAGKKDKKKKKAEAVQEVVEQPVAIVSSSDSVSYAAGVAMTNGLIPYLKQQYQFDEVFMDDFISGFKEAMKLGTDPQQKARMAGMQIAQMVNERMLPNAEDDFKGTPDSIQAQMFQQGFIAALQKDTTHFNQEAAEQFFSDHRVNALKKEGVDFLAANASKEGVKTTASGLQYKVLTQGTGAIPTATDEVKVNYEGRLVNGKVFDSSYKRGEPTKFKANQVIKGWTEALTMMPVGSKWELYIPYELAYGERGAGQDIKPYSALIFTVELLDIEKPVVEEKKEEAKPAAKPITAKKKVVNKKK